MKSPLAISSLIFARGSWVWWSCEALSTTLAYKRPSNRSVT